MHQPIAGCTEQDGLIRGVPHSEVPKFVDGGIGAEKGVSYITGDILYIYIYILYYIYIYVCIYTLPKTNMEPKNEGLEDYFPFQLVIFRFHLSVFFWGYTWMQIPTCPGVIVSS